MFTAALITIVKIRKQPKCPSIDEWMKKKWCIHTAEYDSAIKENEVLPSATTWMGLEGIVHSEIIQTDKYKYQMISLTGRI